MKRPKQIRISENQSREFQVLDTHTEGNPTRIVFSGISIPPGSSVLERQDWLKKNDDQLRKILNFEPRGNPMMCSVLLMPPTENHPDSDFAVIIMEQDEYVPMCGHCIIGTATAIIQLSLVAIKVPVTTISFETIAGEVKCLVQTNKVGSAENVTFQNVKSFLLHQDLSIELDEIGVILVDIAFGGDYYIIVDAQDVGVEVEPSNENQLGSIAKKIIAATNAVTEIVHPFNNAISRCYEVLFTSKASADGTFKHAVISPPGILDRSPCGTGTSARLASLFARGLIQSDLEYAFEGPLGTRFFARATSPQQIKGIMTIVPEVRGRAFVTGLTTVYLQDNDPFQNGIRLDDMQVKSTTEAS